MKTNNTKKRSSTLLKWYRRPRFLVGMLFMLLFAGIGTYTLLKTYAITPQGTYTNWNWTVPADGFTSLKHQLTIDTVSTDAPYFWSHQFQFIGGDGGYIGLQSRGSRVNGTTGKTAVFSIFSSGIAATAGNCKVEQAGFDGYNTSGSSCRIPYEWVTGRAYEMRTARLSADATGILWGGYVKDTVTGVETMIGEIRVPSTWKGHGGWSVMWTEFFGARPATCDLLPYSQVRFSRPTANNGTVLPASTSNYLSSTTECPTSSSTTSGTDAIHKMGNPNFQVADTSAPTVIVSSPAAASMYSPSTGITISGSATDNVAVRSMDILVDGAVVKSATGGSVSTIWQAPAIKGKNKRSRTYTITIRATDTAGNLGTRNTTITVTN